jgi:hypothetical protein
VREGAAASSEGMAPSGPEDVELPPDHELEA